jgi:hypothetical protein
MDYGIIQHNEIMLAPVVMITIPREVVVHIYDYHMLRILVILGMLGGILPTPNIPHIHPGSII